MFFKFLIFFILTDVFCLFSQTDIITTDQIKPGMKGYGKTVFQGTKIEKFDVEIISVLRKIRPRGDLILAKLSGAVIDKAGIIAGMSGSPVFINDKIAGAVAFSWAFSKEPITAITPIQDMLEILERKYNTNFYNFEPNTINKYYADNNNFNLIPIKTPIVFSGISEQGINLFQQEFEQIGFIPVAGGNPGEDVVLPEKFEPGSAVAVDLVTGDMNISAVGTVTYVKQDKVLIFGHPMFFSGTADLPLSFAYIHTVIPSLYNSFKIGASTKIVGRVYQDELSGLAGIVGETPSMIPFALNIDYVGNKKYYNYNIIRTYTMLPQLLGLCIFRSIETAGGWLQNNTLEFDFDISFDNNEKIHIEDTIPGITVNESIANGMLLFLTPISEIMINKFQKVRIRNIKGELKIKPKIKMLEIKKIIVDKNEYEPGDTVNVKVVLKEYQGRIYTKKMEFVLPENLIRGTQMPLIASSGKEAQFVDFLLSPAKYEPYNFEQLIDIINKLSKNTEMTIWSISREKGIVIDGQSIERLPASYFSMLHNSLETGASPVFVLLEKKMLLDYVVVGNASCNIKIKDGAERYRKYPLPQNFRK